MMKIASSNVAMYAASASQTTTKENKEIKAFVGNREASIDEVNRSFKESVYKEMAAHVSSSGWVSESEIELSIEDQAKKRILEELLTRMTGKRVTIEPSEPFRPQASAPLKTSQDNGFAWSFSIKETTTTMEQEKISFGAKALVTTQEGKSLNLSLEIGVSQTFMQQHSMSVEQGGAVFKDPLVIALDGSLPSLSDKKMRFDIDSDGNEDSISYLNKGSGFLAYDQNGNNRIDNGSELFGAQSQNGFEDLKAYDKDNNGWIDENDSIFKDLRIWQVHDDGSNELVALSKADVGAIFLGNSDTPLKAYGSSLKVEGRLVKSGIFLKESGEMGSLHQIDLAV